MANSVEQWVEDLNSYVNKENVNVDEIFSKTFLESKGNHFLNQMMAQEINFKMNVCDRLTEEYEWYAEIYMKKGETVNSREPLYFIFIRSGQNLLAEDLFEDINAIKQILKKSA